MKNAVISGLIIGVLSGLWIFIMPLLGFSPQQGRMSPIEFGSVLIPLIGLYFGVKNYRNTECKGNMGFLEALLQGFKILLIGGVIAVTASIIYIDEFSQEKATLLDFSGRIFGALLVGVLFALGVAALLTTKPNKVD
jgi:hypothetical protein